MIEKRYIAVVGLAAAVLTASACLRNAPADTETKTDNVSASTELLPGELTLSSTAVIFDCEQILLHNVRSSKL